MSKKALVVGGSIKGVQAALDLADAGIEVTLVEQSPWLECKSILHTPKVVRALNHANIKVITQASVSRVTGEKGSLRATVVRQPAYVDQDKCAGCGRCEKVCPVEIRDDSQPPHKAVHPNPKKKPVHSVYAIDKKGIPPCTATCPAGVNTNGYIALLSSGKVAEALDLITEAVPFPRVLGRVCSHPCERKCTRGMIDHPVSICALKRFAADVGAVESSLNRTHHNNSKPSGKPRVAIVGAGPAGLTAARDLARMGHRSTVFEALPVPGGMITVGMPRFRLPREIRQADINDIVRLGIEIQTSTAIGEKLTLGDLRQQYDSILIATGAHRNQTLGITGENLSGVIDSIALLRALNLKQSITVGSRVAVIGGGYTAIDSARTAARLRCERVTILYRRSLGEMPANAEEVAEAQEEGVQIEYLIAPVRIIGKEGKVVGVECIRMGLGEPDSSGRRRPIPIAGSEFLVAADTVIVAVGQRPDLSFLSGDTALTDGRKHIAIDRLTMATKVPGIFAAGDVAGETGTLIDAIAAGRRAAVSIDKYLRGERLGEGRQVAKVIPVQVDLDEVYVPPIERQRMPCLPLAERVGNFEEVDLGFNSEMAFHEAARCLNCAGCSECLECERACELGAIDHKATAQQIELGVDAIIAAEGLLEAGSGVHSISASEADLLEASAIAGRVMVELAHKKSTRQAISHRHEKESRQGAAGNRSGVFVCGCGGNISDIIDIPALLDYSRELEGVAFGAQIGYACTAESAARIKAAIAENNLSHALVAACACCNLDQICFSCSDRRVRCKSNLLDGSTPGVTYEFVNIREQCAWAHANEPAEANAKAKSLIRSTLARISVSELPARRALSLKRSALVVGEGSSAQRAAADLAVQGFHTIAINNGARLLQLERARGGYRATIGENGASSSATVGTVILERSTGNGLPELLAKVCSNQNSTAEPSLSRLPGVFLCGGKGLSQAEALLSGSAAAAKAAILLFKAELEIEQMVVSVDPGKCRACGTCASLCPFQAIKLRSAAEVDEALCQGCGLCVARCPTGALTQAACNDKQINASLEAMLET